MDTDTPNGQAEQNDAPFQIGRAFVSRDDSIGEMRGIGDYCGFPITVRIDRATQEGVSGWRVRIFVRAK